MKLVFCIIVILNVFACGETITKKNSDNRLKIYRSSNGDPKLLASVVHFKDLACSGVQITRQHILTAAHCFATNWEIMPKNFWYKEKVFYTNGKIATIEDIRVPSDLKVVNNIVVQGFDLAIVRISEPTDNPTVKILEDEKEVIDILDENKSRIDRGDHTLLYAGYGFNQSNGYSGFGSLQQAYVPFRHFFGIHSDEIKVGYEKLHGCKGDSGGPLFYHKDSRLELMGIHSRLSILDSANCADNDGTYEVLLSYLPIKKWITKTIDALGGDKGSNHDNSKKKQSNSKAKNEKIEFQDYSILKGELFSREFSIDQFISSFEIEISASNKFNLTIYSPQKKSIQYVINSGWNFLSHFRNEGLQELFLQEPGLWKFEIEPLNSDMTLRNFSFIYR